jgi:hypothetical protein
MHDVLDAPLRSLRIVVGAILGGAVSFFAFVAAFGPLGEEADPPFLSWLSLGVAAMALVMYAIAPSMMEAAGRRSIAGGTNASRGVLVEALGDEGRLFYVNQGRTILAAALVEGAALLCGVGYLLEGETLALAGMGALLLVLALGFPTRGGWERWIDRQSRRLEEERSLSRRS